MQQNLIFALHGFLGEAKDWEKIQSEMAETQIIEWIVPDLFSSKSLNVTDYEAYVDRLIKENKLELPTSKKKIFIGYSLGGRLGLYLLKKYSKLFDAFVFVSTHPGLVFTQEKDERVKSDLAWSDVIKTQAWSAFMKLWNSQPIFNNSDVDPIREEKLFDADKLSAAMRFWSLGLQEDMQKIIQINQSKIIWVVGSEDSKFLTLADELKQKKILLDYSKIFSSHRILNNNPKALVKILQQLF
ncbi:MAG: alpha/beta fold hydrolase [Pseudobdellovibrio sp.]